MNKAFRNPKTMNTWKTVPLGQLASITTGKLDSNAAVEGGRYPFFTCSPETLRIDIPAFESEAVLLAGNNANGVFPVKYYSGQFNAYQRTYIFTTKDRSALDVKYLYYQMRILKQLLGEYSIGTATKFLTLKILAPLPIPIPPLPEQRAIAHVLGTLDDKIENNRRMNETLEGMARAIFKSWFVDFDPVRAKMEGRQPVGMDAETAALFPDSFEDSVMGKIPKGWEVKPLEEVTSLIIDHRGKTPKKMDSDWSANGIPAISAKNIKNARLTRPEMMKFVSDDLFERWMKDPLAEGDILMTSEAPLGELLFLARETDYCLSQRVYGIRSNPEVLLPPILYLWLMSDDCQLELESRATGTTVVGIRQSELRKVSVLVPQRNIQRSLCGILDELLLKIEFQEDEAKTLARIRDAMLPKLLSGEIRVKDAEEVVGVRT